MAPEVRREEVGRVCIVEGYATAGWYSLLSAIVSPGSAAVVLFVSRLSQWAGLPCASVAIPACDGWL